MWKLNWTELGIDWDRLKDVLTYDSTQPMIFSSGLFLFLFLGFSLVYLLLQKKTTEKVVRRMAACFFKGLNKRLQQGRYCDVNRCKTMHCA